MAAAAAPLSTSMLSTSSALKSAMRLTTESCMIEWFPPRLDLVTLKIPEGTDTWLTIIPSTTKSGFRAGVDRGDTAEPYLHSTAGRAVVALDVGAGHFPLQRLIHRLCRGFGEIFGLDGGDGDPEIAPLGPRDAAGDDDLFRQLPGQAHPDIRLILWNRHGRAAISRRAQLDRQRPGGRVGNVERAVRGSSGGQRGALDGDRYARQRVAARDVRHFSLDDARLCSGCSRRTPSECR